MNGPGFSIHFGSIHPSSAAGHGYSGAARRFCD